MCCYSSKASCIISAALPLAGMPAALLLQRGDATVTIIHSRTPNAKEVRRRSLWVGCPGPYAGLHLVASSFRTPNPLLATLVSFAAFNQPLNALHLPAATVDLPGGRHHHRGVRAGGDGQGGLGQAGGGGHRRWHQRRGRECSPSLRCCALALAAVLHSARPALACSAVHKMQWPRSGRANAWQTRCGAGC